MVIEDADVSMLATGQRRIGLSGTGDTDRGETG